MKCMWHLEIRRRTRNVNCGCLQKLKNILGSVELNWLILQTSGKHPLRSRVPQSSCSQEEIVRVKLSSDRWNTERTLVVCYFVFTHSFDRMILNRKSFEYIFWKFIFKTKRKLKLILRNGICIWRRAWRLWGTL